MAAVVLGRSTRSTSQKRWVAAVMSGPSGPTSWRTGLRWVARANVATVPSSVAENSST